MKKTLDEKMNSETADKLRRLGYQEWEIRKGFYDPREVKQA